MTLLCNLANASLINIVSQNSQNLKVRVTSLTKVQQSHLEVFCIANASSGISFLYTTPLSKENYQAQNNRWNRAHKETWLL